MSDLNTPELRDLLALHLIEGLGPQRIGALLEHFGSAARVRRATQGELRSVPGIGEQLASSMAEQLPLVREEPEIERLQRAQVKVHGLGQAGYPEGLKTIPAAPRLLFCKGEIRPEDERAVALVGTRRPDAYGKRIAQRLGEALAREGVTVVSGLARGIDGLAHEGAIAGGGRTLAVLAGGLSSIYPPEHKHLAERVAQVGALISEATMNCEPARWRFPARNRIISGLSRVIVIVQAPADSGALITAEHAAEQGRTVMAVPGAIDNENMTGCHRLLRQGAVLCSTVEDILEELDGVSKRASVERERADGGRTNSASAIARPKLDEVEQKIWDLLEAEPRSGDELARELGIGVGQLSTVLLKLEMKRGVRRLPGNRYERC